MMLVKCDTCTCVHETPLKNNLPFLLETFALFKPHFALQSKQLVVNSLVVEMTVWLI